MTYLYICYRTHSVVTVATPMTDNQPIIPPVRAGRVQSSIDFDYSGYKDEESFSAHGVHKWEFDYDAYYQQTGLDLGRDYPYVHQENGHTLEVQTDYTWMRSTLHDKHSYTLSVEQYGISHKRSAPNCYYVQNGSYRLDDNCVVVSQQDERAPYRVRKSDTDIDVRSPRKLIDERFKNGEDAVRAIHSGTVGASVLGKLHEVLVYDSPDDAVTADTYLAREDRTTNTSSATGD